MKELRYSRNRSPSHNRNPSHNHNRNPSHNHNRNPSHNHNRNPSHNPSHNHNPSRILRRRSSVIWRQVLLLRGSSIWLVKTKEEPDAHSTAVVPVLEQAWQSF
jgi:ABC-type nickel/cobalt efflux system permease component RcnA